MSTKKKKGEEEAPPPEECLPTGYSVNCEVFWIGEELTIEGTGEVLKIGAKGNIVSVTELVDYEREDGTKGYNVEVVNAKFNGVEEPQKLPIKSCSLEPAPLEFVDELDTGLKLPIRGIDIDKLWALKGDFTQQAELLTQLLRLKETYVVPAQRDIVCDFHIYNLDHAKNICLGNVQAAVFIAIMHQMLDMMGKDSARPQELCTVADCTQEFTKLMLNHAKRRPPEQLDIFKGPEVKMLTDFATSTLFKHFLLHQYCLNFDREVETMHVSMGIERPWAPADLVDLQAAEERPKKTKADPRNDIFGKKAAEDPGEAADNGEGAQEETPAVEELTQEQEVEQLVAKKLEETRAKLEAKLKAREDTFFERLDQHAQAKKTKK